MHPLKTPYFAVLSSKGRGLLHLVNICPRPSVYCGVRKDGEWRPIQIHPDVTTRLHIKILAPNYGSTMVDPIGEINGLSIWDHAAK